MRGYRRLLGSMHALAVTGTEDLVCAVQQETRQELASDLGVQVRDDRACPSVLLAVK